jgi:hypothetical protein
MGVGGVWGAGVEVKVKEKGVYWTTRKVVWEKKI